MDRGTAFGRAALPMAFGLAWKGWSSAVRPTAAETDECHERQRAELEFVSAAYDPDTEAWHEVNATGDPVVYRILNLTAHPLQVTLSLTMPPTYPMSEKEPLRISAAVTRDLGSASLLSSAVPKARKTVLNALPTLIKTLQRVADENVGTEAVLAVFSHADEWIANGEWEASLSALTTRETVQESISDSSVRVVFGRRLIYSHHIISKVKRSDIMELAENHRLTGYMKVGWPGLLIIEGREDDCVAFYNSIRRWKWQHLVVRGEQREELLVVASTPSEQEASVQDLRAFQAFVEVDDMSIVAQHCRDVGLEALFRTSLKQYDNGSSGVPSSSALQAPDVIPYGALVHVDHMNDTKGYHKWLQKTAIETGCQLFLKQSYPNDDYSKRPRILVGIIGDSSTDVSSFLKRWRTSRVDIDSRGKACLERMMVVLVEGTLPHAISVEDIMSDDDSLTTTERLLQAMLHSLGGDVWKHALVSLPEGNILR